MNTCHKRRNFIELPFETGPSIKMSSGLQAMFGLLAVEFLWDTRFDSLMQRLL
jgi:hypothetical protein